MSAVALFAAHVTTDVEVLDDDQLDDLVDELAEYHGVPSMLGGRLSVQLTVHAERLVDVSLDAYRAVTRALDEVAPSRDRQVVAIEAMTDDEFSARLEGPPRADDLVSTIEAAELLNVSRQRVLQLADSPGFPEPVRLGVRGLHWSRTGLNRFLSTWDRTPGPRRAVTS